MRSRIVPLQHQLGIMEPLRDSSYPWWTAVFAREHRLGEQDEPRRRQEKTERTSCFLFWRISKPFLAFNSVGMKKTHLHVRYHV
jgi:hypothetical protein